ncbi:MAG: hypothetical protein IJD20_02870 [Oscillospiraceae bacterium]|nr:hypothetical protein [Oscillospiraceae bacterium]
MEKVLMKGNQAFAEACLRAGCRFFSGYPITPQSDVLEYLCWRMEEVGGQCVQTESELAGVNMLYGAAAAGARALTTTSGPGFSLKQEGISYLCASDVPAVIMDVQRIGAGLVQNDDLFQLDAVPPSLSRDHTGQKCCLSRGILPELLRLNGKVSAQIQVIHLTATFPVFPRSHTKTEIFYIFFIFSIDFGRKARYNQ